MIFSQDQPSSVAACAEIWAGKGALVTSKGFSGLEALVRPAHIADEPLPDFTPILSWPGATLLPRRLDHTPVAEAPRPVVLHPSGCVETPLRFDKDHRLFGMLCRPDDSGQSDLAVVIGNSGGDPHHGYARFSVEFARRLASRGITSLRIDFAGLGDSTSPDEAGEEGTTSVFDVDRSPDFSAAFDALGTMGYRRFATYGLCSGAYHSFHASLADRRVVALLLINLPWFSLRHERSGPNSFARRSMAELSRRQVARFLLFSAGDAGIRPLEQHFGPAGVDLCGSGDVEVSIVPGLDHDLTGHAMRQDVAERMIAFLAQVPSLLDHHVIDAPGAQSTQPAEAALSRAFIT